ncbi:MAG: DUF4974 domain-containing protein, partial [Chitinophagaceae bacterium]
LVVDSVNGVEDQTRRLMQVCRMRKTPVIVFWKRLATAAIITLIIGLSVFYYQTERKPIVKTQTQIANDIKPGGNRATLTLANGKVITLDDASNGKLAEQNGIVITKTKDGQLSYAASSKAGLTPEFNTIVTPKGGQYQIHLPDGSKVWLNAASSLKYPTHFTGNERKVTLTGEAYFEVAKASSSKNMPFVVSTGAQTVTVLGTHFNINAYNDDYAYQTTLLEGSVKINYIIKDYGKTVTLNPGEQSNVDGEGLSVKTVNAADAIAWKNGFFLFKDADLKMVMKSISRWYDIEVEYDGQLPNTMFSGEIHRNLTLNQVFEILSFYKVHFKVEGKRIIVSN